MGVEEKEIRGVLSDDAINKCRNYLFTECLWVAENWLGYSAVREDIFSDIENPDALTAAERTKIDELQRTCNEQYQAEQKAWEEKKLMYEGTKYVFITIFNLLILLFALFVPKLQDSISMGLFLGSIAATFGATIFYFGTRSKIGFGLLVVTFFAMLYFINRKKDDFVKWK